MTANEYLEYVDYFNSRLYERYYTDDVRLDLPQKTLLGKHAVRDFYANLNRYVHETIRVRKVLSEGSTLMANIWSDFYCHQDWPEFSVCPVVKGQIVRVELLVIYTLAGDSKFSHIRAGRLTQP